MAIEKFVGLTLEGKNSIHEWKSNIDVPNIDLPDIDLSNFDFPNPSTLTIKSVELATDVEKGEVNVIEIKTKTWDGDVKVPIAILQKGVKDRIFLDVNIPDKATFTLVQGSGPVHLIGHETQRYSDIEEDDTTEDDTDDEEIPQLVPVLKRRRLD